MKKTMNKVFVISLSFLLIFSMYSILTSQIVTAHSPPWNIPSYPFLVASPSPVGVGQRVSVVMWVDNAMPSASLTNDVRRHNYTLTITKPDNSVEKLNWPVVDDTTSIQFYSFTPAQVGEYTLKFDYGGQVYTWNATAAMRTWTNDVFAPASKTITLTVLEEAIPEPVSGYPLPSEYWTRPIEGQNVDWWAVSSNWLGAPFIPGAGAGYGIIGGIQLDGTAPNSPHIMWSRPLQDGGVVGGSSYDTLGKNYYMGGSYQTRFSNALVLHGRLYYELPYGNAGNGGGWICVDLRTGEEIWFNDQMGVSGSGVARPLFGYLYSYDDPNQHGVVPAGGWLFSSNFGTAFEASTGRQSTLNITSVPSGPSVAGPQGEVLRYVWNSAGRWLAQWNSSKVFSTQSSGNINAGTMARYDWNISISGLGSGSWAINTGPAYTSLDTYNVGVAYDNIILLRHGSLGELGNWNGANITAISLKPECRGQILWTKHYPAAPGNVTRAVVGWDTKNGVFITQDKETMVLNGFSLSNGNKLWGPTEPAGDYSFFRQSTMVAYDKVYYAGYGGVLYCYDVLTGERLWTYGNDPSNPRNSTYAGMATAWGHYPIFIDVISDGKIYLATTEHSPNSPYYKDVRYRCVNATTGEQIWTLMGWGTGMDAAHDVIADGFFVFLNCYDMQIYCVGKGPSAITVEAPKAGLEFGKSLIISGTVTDVSAGTEQDVIARRFPNGVPAVSDESMRSWMEYVYMQKPKPSDVTGVTVELFVTDANNNYRSIGTTTTDSNGFYSYQWIPDISGKYVVYAKFAGSESYWPSNAITAFAVDDVEATATPTESPPLTVEQYFLPAIIGLAVAMIIGFAILILLILKKKE